LKANVQNKSVFSGHKDALHCCISLRLLLAAISSLLLPSLTEISAKVKEVILGIFVFIIIEVSA
jgi:hypothetical protein